MKSKNPSVTLEYFQRRRQELTRALADAGEHVDDTSAESGPILSSADQYRARIDEVDFWLTRIERSCALAALHPGMSVPRRYRRSGATTEIVALAYREPSIEIDRLVVAVYGKCRPRGTTQHILRVLVTRLIREGCVTREGSKLDLTQECRAAWEASPLFTTA